VGTNQQPQNVWPDGSARKWADGADRSWGNCFTHCLDGSPHGYTAGSPVAESPESRKRGPRSHTAFGVSGGTMLGMGREAAPIPRLRPQSPPAHILRPKRAA
jgi:hypothetical protein